MKRTRSKDWLDMGLHLLSQDGVSALTLDRLCDAMHKTKGSFYHHFGDMKSYVGALLAHWQANLTQAAIDQAETAPDPKARLALLDRTVRSLDHRLDQIIRTWAKQDPRAAQVLAEVDQTRIDYIRELFEANGLEPQLAHRLAELEYTAFLGAQQRFGDLNSPEAEQVASTLRRAIEALVHTSRQP